MTVKLWSEGSGGRLMDANLAPNAWNEAIVGMQTPAQVADRINSGKWMPWANAILENTKRGDYVLELGSGTGELSAVLALERRNVMLMDFSLKSLEFSMKVFERLKLDGSFSEGDVLKKFPCSDGMFDCVFSSGLLEHFTFDDQVDILREAKRVTRNRVISLVPNAASIPYRLGKWMQERAGTWKWGRENPCHSLREMYHKAGISTVIEYSIEPLHALNFLDFQEFETFRKMFSLWMCSLSRDETERLNQGYLLVSIGYKD